MIVPARVNEYNPRMPGFFKKTFMILIETHTYRMKMVKPFVLEKTPGQGYWAE